MIKDKYSALSSKTFVGESYLLLLLLLLWLLLFLLLLLLAMCCRWSAEQEHQKQKDDWSLCGILESRETMEVTHWETFPPELVKGRNWKLTPRFQKFWFWKWKTGKSWVLKMEKKQEILEFWKWDQQEFPEFWKWINRKFLILKVDQQEITVWKWINRKFLILKMDNQEVPNFESG